MSQNLDRTVVPMFTGSMVIDFNQMTRGGLYSLRMLCETEATKNPDQGVARMYWESARAIHELQQERK